jgi:hypothetical protein
MVENKETWDSPSKIHKADLVTLSFFVSEIYHLGNAKNYLATMLAKLKSGAIVVMNDNRTDEVHQLMDSLANEVGLKRLSAGEGKNEICDSGEDMALIKKYTDKFGSSKLTGQCAWRIYVKP